MAVTVTGLQIAQLLVERRGLGLYIASNQSTIAAGSVTSAYYFANSNWGGNELLSRNAGFWGPENTTGLADDWRPAGTLTASNGAVAISPNFTDTTARNLYCLYHGIHPQFIIDACNQALRDVYTPALEPLCIKPASTVTLDAGFQNSATTSWTESDADGGPATTFSKVSTADSDVVYPGMIRAGLIVNTQAGGYIRQRFNMTEGDTFNVFALSRLASGTNAELVLRDVTNAAAIGSTVEHDQGSWQWMRRVGEVVPDGSKLVEVRLQGEGASDNVYWQALCVYPQRARVIELATTWDTSYKLPSLLYVRLGGRSVATGIYDARASELVEVPRHAYDFLMVRPGANPYAIQFHDTTYLQYPLFIQGRRAHVDIEGPFTRAMTETVSADRDLFEAAVARRLLMDTRWTMPDKEQALAQAQADYQRYSQQFTYQGPAERRPFWVMPSLSN